MWSDAPVFKTKKIWEANSENLPSLFEPDIISPTLTYPNLTYPILSYPNLT